MVELFFLQHHQHHSYCKRVYDGLMAHHPRCVLSMETRNCHHHHQKTCNRRCVRRRWMVRDRNDKWKYKISPRGRRWWVVWGSLWWVLLWLVLWLMLLWLMLLWCSSPLLQPRPEYWTTTIPRLVWWLAMLVHGFDGASCSVERGSVK